VAGLERISEVFKVLLWDHSKTLKLSPIQIQVMIFLAFHREELRNVSTLAQEFNVAKSTISDTIGILEKKGLIQKSPSIIDARAYSIHLTEEGLDLLKEAMNFADPLYQAVNQLGSEEKTKIFETLILLISQLNKKGVLSVQRSCFNCRFLEKRSKGHYCKFLETRLHESELRLDCPEFASK
jgi:DNA-binding MarR family transcriptional regulator